MAPTLIEVVDMFREQLFSWLEWHPRPGLLSGRVVVITGASGGLGLETAVHLGKLNPSLVILACRNLQKGKEAKARVLKETGLTEARVEVWPLDLASFASVRVFGERCKAELSRVDVFVQNAGVETYKWGMTEDGWEYNLQVNTLATGLLGVLLLPLLGKTAKLPLEPGMQPFKPHQTIVGSTAHHLCTYRRPSPPAIILADLNDPDSHGAPVTGEDRYNITKLAQIFIARQLARLPAAEGVTVNVVHPGVCVSDFRKEYPAVKAWILDKLSWSTADGAKNIAWAATEETPAGAYVSATRVKQPSAFSRSEQGLLLEHELWAEMVAEWVKIVPEAEKVVA